jgi:hypothetical protein
MHSSSGTARLSTGLAVATLLPACALEPGDPWGLVQPTLEVGLSVPPGRLDDTGRLRTSDDYRVTVESVRLEVDALELVAGESGVLSFDPANPPPGYSLCHNGHCHADDGRLVDYADIEAELAGGGGATGPLIAVPGDTAAFDASAPVLLSLGGCADDGCVIDAPVTVALLRARITAFHLEARVEDARVGEAARLPEGGVPVSVSLTAASPGDSLESAAVAVSLRFGPGEDAGLALSLGLSVGPELFDGQPWAASSAELETAMASALGPALSLEVFGATRFDP